MTDDSVSRAYTAILRTRDPRLSMRVFPDSRDPKRSAYWVCYGIGSDRPVKLTTLEALAMGNPHRRGPGLWILDALERRSWQHTVTEATTHLSIR